jgi:hypothetical protein
MVFDPDAAPSGRRQFLDWYEQQTKWAEGHDYNDPKVPSAKLQSGLLDILRLYSPLNSPPAQDDLPEDEDSTTDRSLSRVVIYDGFRWSRTEPAYKTVFELAEKRGVSFFDVHSNGSKAVAAGGRRTPARAIVTCNRF